MDGYFYNSVDGMGLLGQVLGLIMWNVACRAADVDLKGNRQVVFFSRFLECSRERELQTKKVWSKRN